MAGAIIAMTVFIEVIAMPNQSVPAAGRADIAMPECLVPKASDVLSDLCGMNQRGCRDRLDGLSRWVRICQRVTAPQTSRNRCIRRVHPVTNPDSVRERKTANLDCAKRPNTKMARDRPSRHKPRICTPTFPENLGNVSPWPLNLLRNCWPISIIFREITSHNGSGDCVFLRLSDFESLSTERIVLPCVGPIVLPLRSVTLTPG